MLGPTFKEKRRNSRRAALAELTQLSEELGLYEHDLEESKE